MGDGEQQQHDEPSDEEQDRTTDSHGDSPLWLMSYVCTLTAGNIASRREVSRNRARNPREKRVKSSGEP